MSKDLNELLKEIQDEQRQQIEQDAEILAEAIASDMKLSGDVVSIIRQITETIVRQAREENVSVDEIAKRLDFEITDTPDTIKEHVVKVEYPAKFISDSSELRRKLPHIAIDGEETDVSKMGVSVVLKAVDDDKVVLSENLTHYDLLVYSSICSFIESGIGNSENEISENKRYFTPKIVYQCMNPNSRKDLTDESPEIVEIKKSIDKMRHIKTKINYTGFIKNRKGKKDNIDDEILATATVEDWFLNAAKVTVNINGEQAEGYKLNTVPAMFWKSKQTVKQLVTYDRNLLQLEGTRDHSKTNENALLKHEILTHLQALKSGKSKLSKKIKYDTLFERCGIEPTNRLQHQRKRDFIKKYLDYLKEQGEIKDYKEYKEGTRLVGIEFILK